MNCPMCDQEIHSFTMTQDVQKLLHCPDGYDVVGSDFGWPMLIPRSGKVEEYPVAGRTHYRLVPCGCPVDRVECVGAGVFKFTGKDKEFKPVEFTGPIKGFQTSVREME